MKRKKTTEGALGKGQPDTKGRKNVGKKLKNTGEAEFREVTLDSKKDNLFLVVSGPSGAGKNTMIRHILDSRENVSHGVSATTRDPRGKEQNGVEYYFLSLEEFEKLEEEGRFYETDVYKGNRYGTVKFDINRRIAAGDNVALDLTVAGALNIKKEFGDSAKTVFIFPPSLETLKNRLDLRATDTPEVIRDRMKVAVEKEIDQYCEFDYIMVNDDLDVAKAAILAIYDSLTLKDENSVKAAEQFKKANSLEFADNMVKRLKKEAGID